MRWNIVVKQLFLLLCFTGILHGQEHKAPAHYNPFLKTTAAKRGQQQHKATALSLPFFEDFTNYDVYPDESRWADYEVYVNNTMGINPISRGVATFDALNQYGLPYDTLSNGDFRYADSLTSQPIDLSSYTASDSLYLSFFYQPQGNGFAPLGGDTLFLFMKKSDGDWIPVWRTPGATLQPFRQQMIAITDSDYFSGGFQFRFINIAAFEYSGAVWNVDYIRLDANRNIYDTLVNDVAFTTDPNSLLNDYTSMPYRQFMVNPAAERALHYTDSIRNNYENYQSLTYGFIATDTASGTQLNTDNPNTFNAPPSASQQLSFPAYANTVPLQSQYQSVVFENKYYIESVSAADPKPNDTIIKRQVFDNYLAYDDGTAEQTYYLSQSQTLPADIAIEFHLNQPDTMQGMAIYFGRTVPLDTGKQFSIAIYSSLAGVNGAGATHLLRQQNLYQAAFTDSINQFYVYRLDTPVALPAGTFYAGTIQAAYGGADSLYIGLDVNRAGPNHVYFNVLNEWDASEIIGAVMMRPLLGQPVFSTSVINNRTVTDWSVSPNPASNSIHFNYNADKQAAYEITNIQGISVQRGKLKQNENITISQLSPGMYFVNLIFDDVPSSKPVKIIKY